MGLGIWSMHFVGMLAFKLPIPLGYDVGITLASLAIAIAASAFALWLVSRRELPWQHLLGGALLMGVDLVKETAVLNAAYDDAAGVTAAFNLNMLQHINRLIGADFDTGQWRHLAFFNEAQSRIEMHLRARRPLTVAWPGGGRRFAEGETIHTESSRKYDAASVRALAEAAGWRLEAFETDLLALLRDEDVHPTHRQFTLLDGGDVIDPDTGEVL